jgi:YjbR
MTAAPAPGPGPAERLFRDIGRKLLEEPDVAEGTGFGTNPGLRVGTKVFAMLGRGQLVVKLPEARVDELVAAGVAERFDPRRDGRLMKEWVTVPISERRRWRRLVDEALGFVRTGRR